MSQKPTQAAKGRLRRVTLPGLISFLCSLLLLSIVLIWSDATRKVDRLLHDSWVRQVQRDVPDDVYIVAIDSNSLNSVGRWPWPRQEQAQLFESLASYGARVVIIDLLYTEASESSADDKRLASAIGSLNASVLPVLTERGGAGISRESLPVSDITRQVSNLGHVFLPIDDDGIVRRVNIKAGINQAHWPSLSLAGLEVLGLAPDPLPGRMVQQTASEARWVQNNEVYIPFYGPSGTFARVSAVDVLSGAVPEGLLEDQIVFVGLTATGLGDVVPTPVSALDQPVPGVEIHANVFSALRDGTTVTSVNRYSAFLVALGLLPFMLLVYYRAPPEWGLLCAVAGALFPLVLSFMLYRFAGLWFEPLSASVPILVSYLLWSRHRLRYVNRFLEREQVKAAEHMPERIVADNEALADFFHSASRHLPIKGWRFSVGTEQFSGGESLPILLPAGVDGRWSVRRDIYVRRYSAPQSLLVEMRIEDDGIGIQIAKYVDTLARVRAREQASRLAGSVERLQTNVLTLSEQLNWLRNVKVFSDTVLAAAPAGFAVWNPAGECIRANALVNQQVNGYPERGELVDFLRCLDRELTNGQDADDFHDLTINRKPWQFSYRQEERELVVNFRAVGARLADRLICVSVIDVTDIRTAEKARAEMVDYLSHDLRSPLISALYLLETDSDPRISSNIRNSLSMMDDLLHIARADGLSESLFEPLLLNSVLDNTLDQLLPQARSRGIRFDVQSADDDLWVVGDAASLERAFTNIVGNAIKYSSDSTVVTIKLLDDDTHARLTVDDQGVGIDPGMLDKLFTRFKRDSSRADDREGIGLGLALVSRVVGLHGGQVKASNLPVGTRITLSLPLEKTGSIDETGLLAENQTRQQPPALIQAR